MSETAGSPDHHLAATIALAAGAAVAGVALYNHFKPEKNYSGGYNFFQIVGNLDSCIRGSVGEDVGYVMLGGGASAALANTETILRDNLIVPPTGIRKDQYRENGTLSDCDILVFSSDEEVIDAVRASITPNQLILNGGTDAERARELAKPGARLKVGVTGLRAGDEFTEEPVGIKDKILHAVGKDWVSHRLEYTDGRRTFLIGDVEVDLPDEYFEPYQLLLDSGERIPVLHPLIQVLSYACRASHGIRRRDIEKVTEIMDVIEDRFGAKLVFSEKGQIATITVDPLYDPGNGVKAAIEFTKQKNALRWRNTKDRLGKPEAALLATRIALHRQLDTRAIFIQFGQGGWLFDNVLSRFSGERQQAINHQPETSESSDDNLAADLVH